MGIDVGADVDDLKLWVIDIVLRMIGDIFEQVQEGGIFSLHIHRIVIIVIIRHAIFSFFGLAFASCGFFAGSYFSDSENGNLSP